jgi:hypothetical protein
MIGEDPTPDRDLDPDAGLDRGSAAPAHPLELALRHGMRYSGLRDLELDPRLLLYVPLEICEREMVVPLSVGDELLEVATAFLDPDLDVTEGRFPDLTIELVFAPIERIAERHDELRAEL